MLPFRIFFHCHDFPLNSSVFLIIVTTFFCGIIVISFFSRRIKILCSAHWIVVHVKHAIHIWLHSVLSLQFLWKYSSSVGPRQTRVIIKFDDNKIHCWMVCSSSLIQLLHAHTIHIVHSNDWTKRTKNNFLQQPNMTNYSWMHVVAQQLTTE